MKNSNVGATHTGAFREWKEDFETVEIFLPLPPAPASFSVDVMLTSGLTVVVPHPHRSVDDRWFVIAKDANAKSHLLARFQPLPSHPSHELAKK